MPTVVKTDFTLCDISADGYLNLMNDEGETREDLKLPADAELAAEVKVRSNMNYLSLSPYAFTFAHCVCCLFGLVLPPAPCFVLLHLYLCVLLCGGQKAEGV